MKWIGTTALILGASSSSSAAAKDQFSWGKAGVSLLQYRADAIECGRLGASHDIRDAEPTARFLRYFNAQQQVLNGPPGQTTGDYQSIQRLYRPQQRVADVQAMLVSITEQCLSDRGYRRFRLTKDQARALNRLPKGSRSRHLYLHSLASDQAILASQVP